ncbi:MAG TPA: fasciclin domain-containing protein [Flavitalea sp.]|nr:fasciclin domain-containing protein [Flavitalea sp.]
MTTITFPKWTALLAAVLILVTGCKKDDWSDFNPKGHKNTEKKSIAELVKMSPRHKFLYAAVVKAGLASTLSAPGTFTVFAPTDDAFKAAGFSSVKAIQDAPADVLQGILLYHALGTEVTAEAVQGKSAMPVSTLAGKDFYVSGSNGNVWVNDARVITKNIMANNGVIHVIDKVLMPPSKNLVQLAQSVPELSTLVAAVIQLGQPTVDLLATGGPFTVMAPTNDAFAALLKKLNLPNLASIPNDVLASVLTYHLIPGRVFSYNLSEGLMPATVNGEKLTFSLAGGATVKGKSNDTPSNIIAVNVLATNGVVHVIDQVLLP